jgi:DNA-binding FadR family transcriptional regulator
MPSSRRTTKVAEVLAREIVRDIRSLTPSSKLPPEAEMLAKYGVGRGSLREALRILEVQGLIVIRPGPGGGPIVAPFDNRHFARMTSLYCSLAGATYRDIMEARLAMEPVMARLAAERQDPTAVAKLQQAVDSQPVDLGDPRYIESVREFHTVVASVSGNAVLDLIAGALRIVYTDKIWYRVFPPELSTTVEKDHRAIATAIARGQAARAEKLMRRHMEDFVRHSEARNPGLLDQVVDWG